MRELSREAFEHDDPNSIRHRTDMREKAERDAVDFVAVPSPLRPRGKELTGVDFDADSKGFMFAFGNPSQNFSAALGDNPLPEAVRADAQEYRRWVLSEEKARRRFRRTIKRNRKEKETWGWHKCGAVSMVLTVPPWAMSVLNALEDDVRDVLLLGVADVAARRMQEVSGRVPWGGGCHLDTDIAHFHFQVPKTSPCAENWPKSSFKTGGPWLVGADRIERAFPGLLPEKQRELMEGHKQRKGQLVDLEIAAAVDNFLDHKFKEMGLESNYNQAKAEYAKRKVRSRNIERERSLVKEALRFFVVEGVWPLAVTTMRLSMWRMIPREYRLLIYGSIRAFQIIASPTKAAVTASVQLIAKQLKREILPEPEPIPSFRV